MLDEKSVEIPLGQLQKFSNPGVKGDVGNGDVLMKIDVIVVKHGSGDSNSRPI